MSVKSHTGHRFLQHRARHSVVPSATPAMLRGNRLRVRESPRQGADAPSCVHLCNVERNVTEYVAEVELDPKPATVARTTATMDRHAM